MQVIVKMLNFLRAKGFNCQLQEFLKSVNANYGDVIYFSEAR